MERQKIPVMKVPVKDGLLLKYVENKLASLFFSCIHQHIQVTSRFTQHMISFLVNYYTVFLFFLKKLGNNYHFSQVSNIIGRTSSATRSKRDDDPSIALRDSSLFPFL